MKNKLNFRIMRQGYDRFEVDQEITALKEEITSLQAALDTAQQSLKTSDNKIAVLKRRYKKLLNEATVRERAAEEMSRVALREANQIIDTAYRNADMIVREAMSTARQLLVEIARISGESHEMRGELVDKLDALTQVVDGLEFPEIPNIKDLG